MAYEFYGNESVLQLLTDSLSKNRLAHAYLFYGEKGLGKCTLAIQFAQAILCKCNDAPCHHCVSCNKIKKNIHPDCTILGGETGKNQFHAETIREMRSQAFVMPNESAYRVFILQNVQAMSQTAANALLKILEEPPKNVIFLLTCQDKSSLLQTISSRCLPIRIAPVSPALCKQAVLSSLGESTENLEQIIRLCDGSIGQALFWIQDEKGRAAFTIMQKLSEALCTGDGLNILQALAPLEQDAMLFEEVLLCLKRRFRAALQNRFAQTGQNDRLSSSLSLRQIIKDIECVQRLERALQQNANLRLAATWLSANLK